MCNVITIPSVAWLRRAVRRWRSRGSRSAAVPVGYVAVCAEGARFVVRLAHLGHPAFLELLRQADEEYGFPAGASGPVALTCDEDHLRDVLRRVSSSSSRNNAPSATVTETHGRCCRGWPERSSSRENRLTARTALQQNRSKQPVTRYSGQTR
ncbi:hypothetical protein ACQ4PT_053989 [Festuca glaucescens]